MCAAHVVLPRSTQPSIPITTAMENFYEDIVVASSSSSIGSSRRKKLSAKMIHDIHVLHKMLKTWASSSGSKGGSRKNSSCDEDSVPPPEFWW